jgi:hypothetical protein
MYLGHPWMLQIFTGRPPLGPNAMAKYDLELRVVDGLGLSDLEMDAVISLVNSHVEGVARRKVEAALVERRTGVTDKQWWQATAAPLAEVFDPEQFPVANRVGNVAGEAHYAAHGTEYELTFGLDRLIDGIAAISRP